MKTTLFKNTPLLIMLLTLLSCTAWCGTLPPASVSSDPAKSSMRLLGHQLKSHEELVREYRSRTQAAKAYWTHKSRSSEPVTFSTEGMSITFAPDGGVEVKRGEDVVSVPDCMGWSIYNWTDERKAGGRKVKEGTRTPLDNMAQVGPEELMLWSSDASFLVNVAIKAKDRYFTFELLHVSNDPQTGDLDKKNWAGHRVEFAVDIEKQPDNWMTHKLLLNPMAELFYWRLPYATGPRIFFCWPYPMWSQTEDRPQPQGMASVFGFAGDAEHDDILADVWAGEPTLPRPNRAQLTSWTRADVNAWLDRWIAEVGKPWKEASFSPHKDPKNLYGMADVAAESGITKIGLHPFDWQGTTKGEPSPHLFPKGAEDAVKWREYCDTRGIRLHFHGFGAIVRSNDSKYGLGVMPDDLAKSARGTLVKDITEDQTTILVKPDLDFYPWMKPGMPPFARPLWGNSNSGFGTTFPPYLEGNNSLISIDKTPYGYSATLTEDNLWKIELGGPFRGHTRKAHKAGDIVDFIAIGSGGWTVLDPRSKLYEQQATDYATVLNMFKSNTLYDGAGWSEPLGTWSIRKYKQMVYEQLDHPQSGALMESRFRKVKNLSFGRSGHMAFNPRGAAILASSIDDSIRGINKGVRSKDMSIRGNHTGISIDLPETHGCWKEAMDHFRLWFDLKPHLTDEQKLAITGSGKGHKNKLKAKQDIFVATDAGNRWEIRKKRAMRREGIDAPWQKVPERPDAAPRQFFKANGQELEGLYNPYVSQTPVIELNVMAGMSTKHDGNTSLMPMRASDVQCQESSGSELQHNGIAGGVGQKAHFNGGIFTVAVDNSESKTDYKYYYRARKGEKNMHWLPESAGLPAKFDMSKSRGVSITVVGDGSGSTLVFGAGKGFPRSYGITIDFVGKRIFEIPHGEAINNMAIWDPHAGATITANSYHMNEFSLYLHHVPAGEKAKIKVLDIQAMGEDRDTGLIDPLLSLNGIRVAVKGTIPYDHYLVYSEGSDAKVYGPNWHLVKELPVRTSGKPVAIAGANTFSVSAPKSPNAWLSSRIKVVDLDNPITVKKPKL